MKTILKILINLWKLLKNWQKIALGVLILMGGAFFLGRWSMSIKTITVVETKIVPKFITEIDTAKTKKAIDSLWVEAKKFWEGKPRPIKEIIKRDTITNKIIDTVYVKKNINYVAALDTTYSDNHFRFKLAFVSPIPVHPSSYFRISVVSEYTEPVLPKSWFHKFYLFAGVSIKYLDGVKARFPIGMGYDFYEMGHLSLSLEYSTELNFIKRTHQIELINKFRF